MLNPSRSGRNTEKKMLTSERLESFHERVPVRPAQLRRPKIDLDLFFDRKLKEEVAVAPPRLTKLLVNVTLQGSLGVVHVIMSLESTVEELIAVALRLYKKEARRPLLQTENPLCFDLHYSSFSLEICNGADVLILSMSISGNQIIGSLSQRHDSVLSWKAF